MDHEGHKGHKGNQKSLSTEDTEGTKDTKGRRSFPRYVGTGYISLIRIHGRFTFVTSVPFVSFVSKLWTVRSFVFLRVLRG